MKYNKKGDDTIPRIARKDINTPFMHIMVQGVNKEYIFYKKEYIERYLQIIKRFQKDYDIKIIAYCIMNNHAHFLIHVNDKTTLGKFMQKVNLIYSQMYNSLEKRCGVLFRNRYKSEPIQDREHLINCIKYIHNNPVKANMVAKCEDYKYSSYHNFFNKNYVPQDDILKEIFGSNCNYLQLIQNASNRRFMDIEEETKENVNDYISIGIVEFQRIYSIKSVDILSSRETFKSLIIYLKEKLGLKYVEIEKFFDVPRGVMNCLKKK